MGSTNHVESKSCVILDCGIRVEYSAVLNSGEKRLSQFSLSKEVGECSSEIFSTKKQKRHTARPRHPNVPVKVPVVFVETVV